MAKLISPGVPVTLVHGSPSADYEEACSSCGLTMNQSRMLAALNGQSFEVPPGLTREETRAFILSKADFVTEDVRQALGEALTTLLGQMSHNATMSPDWFDSRNMDYVLDVIFETLRLKQPAIDPGVLVRLNDATKPLDIADRNLLMRYFMDK